MATIVVYGGGFQPFHEGHLSSYLQAKKAFPDATFYVAASNDVKQRPIPFKDKQFLSQQAGVVDPFVETKNPINPQEILAQYNPEQDVYVMVRSERDPVGYTKKDGTPAYYQPYVKGQPMAPFSKHGYVFVTKKHNFTVDGQEVYSGSQVRSMYGSADDEGRMKIIQQLYPKSKQQQMIKKLLDQYLSSPQEPTVMPTKTTAMSKLKNKQLAEQISKIRPLIKEASPAMKLKFMRLMKTAITESKVNELSPQTLASYKKKAGADATASDKVGNFKRGDKRMSGIMKATRKEFDNDAKGVAEGSDDPWGPHGNFAGDTPVNIGGDTVKRLEVGDIVKYIDQKAKILAQSKDRKYSRITISSGFGGTTKDVLTSDLKRLGGSVTEDEVEETKLSTMRDYYAGNKDAKDPTKLSQMRDYFNKVDSSKKSTVKPEIMKRREPSVAESNIPESTDYLEEK